MVSDRGLIKHKSRLCAHVGMPKLGVNYWDTYSPVVNCMSFRAILTQSVLWDIHTKSVDFVLDYTQADVETDIFMELTIFFLELKGTTPENW